MLMSKCCFRMISRVTALSSGLEWFFTGHASTALPVDDREACLGKGAEQKPRLDSRHVTTLQDTGWGAEEMHIMIDKERQFLRGGC